MDTIDRILKLVKESGLTAKEYAINAGLGAGNITDWKTGRSKPSVESLQKIAKHANVQLEWLTGDSEYRSKEEEIKSLIDFTQKESGLERNIVSFSLGEDLNLSLEESRLLEEIVALLSNAIENNNVENFDIHNYLQNQNEDSKKRIINALTIVTSSQAYVFSRLALNSQQEHMKYLDNNISFLENLNSDFEKHLNNRHQYYMCPVYGQISAGQPNWVEECIEGRLPLDTDLMGIVNPEEHFFLRVNGESMNKIIKNGAFALIHKQDYINNGEIAVVLVNGYDATLKKFTKQGNFVILEPQSTDDSFETQIYDKKTSIKILGKYIGKMEIN